MSQSTTSNTPSTATPPSVSAADYAVSAPDISSAARQALGQGATDGTEAAVTFAERAFYDDHCFATPPGTEVNRCVRDLGDGMAAATQADWAKSIRGFLADAADDSYGKSQASGNVLSLTFYGALSGTNHLSGGRTLSVEPDGPVFVDKQISHVTSLLNNDGRLRVTMRAAARARVVLDGKESLWSLKRHCIFYMKNISGDWKVDSWHGGFDAGKIKPQ